MHIIIIIGYIKQGGVQWIAQTERGEGTRIVWCACLGRVQWRGVFFSIFLNDLSKKTDGLIFFSKFLIYFFSNF